WRSASAVRRALARASFCWYCSSSATCSSSSAVCRSSRTAGNTSAACPGSAATRWCKAVISWCRAAILLSTRRSHMPAPFLHEQDDPLRVLRRTNERCTGDTALNGLAPAVRSPEYNLLERRPPTQHGPHRGPQLLDRQANIQAQQR